MNNILENRKFKNLVLSIILIIAVVFILQIDFVKEILYLLVLSGIVTYTLKPLQRFLIKKGMSCKISALILVVGVLIGIILLFTTLIPSFFKESLNIGNSLEELGQYITALQGRIKVINDNKIINQILSRVYARGNEIIIGVLENLFNATANLGENALSFVVVPIITYYLLSDTSYIGNKLLLIYPIKGRMLIKRINKDVDKILGRYIAGKFILCLLVGLLTFIVLTTFKVKLPLILSILNGVFNIIPYFGPVIGMIPSVILALLDSPRKALYTAIGLYIIQILEGNILSPKVTSASVNMHPLAVIIILIIGGEIGGFLGMILAVPAAVIIKVIYEDLNYYLF